MMRIKRALKQSYYCLQNIRETVRLKNEMNGILTSNKQTCIPLSLEEKNTIDNYWKPYGITPDYKPYQFYYGFTGIKSPEFIPRPLFKIKMKPIMNDEKLAGAWSDKAYLDFFIKDVRTPRALIRNVSGRLIDSNYNCISFDDAQRVVNSVEKIVVKPTLYTHTGQGVKLFNTPINIYDIDKHYERNYVIQLPLEQHEFMSNFNMSSVNTIRFNTVLLDDGVHVMSAFLKVGQAGEFADNSGKKRYFIGIDMQGKLLDYAMDHNYIKYNDIPSAFDFAGKEIPCYDRLCQLVQDAHKIIPHFGFAFWDVCLCKDGFPTIVEVNLRDPDITVSQAVCGPFFGKWTNKVLEYLEKSK